MFSKKQMAFMNVDMMSCCYVICFSFKESVSLWHSYK